MIMITTTANMATIMATMDIIMKEDTKKHMDMGMDIHTGKKNMDMDMGMKTEN